jgi:hypothetical protein
LDPLRKKNLGVGDRSTDVLLPEVSFTALLELFKSNDFARTRPHQHKEMPAYDFIRAAQEEGANIIQDFHESLSVRAGKRYAIIADVCAFANTNGGTLYIGLSADPNKPIIGVTDAEQAVAQLDKELNKRLTPPLPYTLDIHESGGKKIVRILVPRGEDPPYAVDDNKIYLRSEAETGLAVRDEIVELVSRGAMIKSGDAEPAVQLPAPTADTTRHSPPPEVSGTPPRTGVEVVSVEERSGEKYYTVRDLRNNNVVKNVTRKSARLLWHYAITTFSKLPPDPHQWGIHWQGDLGMLSRQKQGKSMRYDLVQRTPHGFRYFFGVTEDGVHGSWKQLVGQEDE